MKTVFERMTAFVSQHTLQALLILGLVHGLIYAAIIPPWWNHDEAGHFEYAWLVANRSTWPQPGDYDNAMRLLVAESSLRLGIDSIFNFKEENRNDDPIRIGVPQVGDLPIYYWLAALPLRVLRGVDMLVQMYVLRVLSVGLLVLTLYCAWKFVEELFPQNHALAWMVTLFLALLPGFVNVVASVNNDAAAAAAGAFFLWMSARILKRGFSIPNLLGWFAAIGICLFTRDITRVLLVSTPFVLWGRVANRRLFLAPLMAGVALAVIALPFMLTKKDAQYWFRIPAGVTSNRIEEARAPFGKFALVSDASAYDFGQALPENSIRSLRNKTLTLGVWMWADQPLPVSSPIINFVLASRLPMQNYSQPVDIDTVPKFYTLQATVPNETISVLVRINPGVSQTRIYYDGWVLADEPFSTTPPQFADDTLSAGTWDGKPFNNLMRNASAEQTWFNVAAWVDQKTQRVPFLQGHVSLLLIGVEDRQAFGWYYSQMISKLMQTFWGKPAAAQVSLPVPFYDIEQVLVALAVLGVGILLYRRRPWPLQVLTFPAVAVLAVWGVTALRGAPEVLVMGTVPWARYALPAFVPAVLVLCAGWNEILNWLASLLKNPELGARLFIAFMVGFAIYVAFTAVTHFFPAVVNLQQIIILFAFAVSTLWILEKISLLKTTV